MGTPATRKRSAGSPTPACRPTAFVVRDWSRDDARYLPARALGDSKGAVELGGHGATHRALDRLTAGELADEAAASRDYVSEIAGSAATTMALPGGHGGPRELAAAAQAGFTLGGNSRALPHRRLGASVTRLCVHSGHEAQARSSAGSRPARCGGL